MGKIALEGMEFFAYHGYYLEEQKMGNRYGADVIIYTDFLEAGENDDLGQTINYEQIYELVKQEMLAPVRLLETLAMRVANGLLSRYNQVNEVEVKVRKFNPPVGGVCHSASVELRKNRHDFEKKS